MAEVSGGGKLRPDPEIGGETKKFPKIVYNEQVTKMFELSIPMLINELGLDIKSTPELKMDEDTSSRVDWISEIDEDEIDPLEFYDSDAFDENIEIGEDQRDESFSSEPSEDFFQYAWRRLEEDFNADDEEDKSIINQIAEILEKFETENFTISNVPEELKHWFEALYREFPENIVFESEQYEKHAEIIFYWHGNDIEYDIDLGFLDRISINSDKKNSMILSDKMSLSQFQLFIEERRMMMTLLAMLLVEKQSAFFKAPNIRVAVEKLKGLQQVDFIEYLKSVGIKKDKSIISRLIMDKWFSVPFQKGYLPLSLLFYDKNTFDIGVLQAIIELHVLKNKQAPLKRVDQLVVLKILTGRETGSKTISLHLHPPLREIFPGTDEYHYSLGIKGKRGRKSEKQSINDSDLTKLINTVGFNLGILDKEITKKSVNEIRAEAENKEKEQNAKKEIIV